VGTNPLMAQGRRSIGMPKIDARLMITTSQGRCGNIRRDKQTPTERKNSLTGGFYAMSAIGPKPT